jgi:hypothetical protein
MQYGRLEQQAYLKQANLDVFVISQVETIELVNEIDEVLKIPGLDSLVLGPQDLSGSMGRLGETTHPDVVAAMTTEGRWKVYRFGAGSESEIRQALDGMRCPVDAGWQRLRIHDPQLRTNISRNSW